MIAQMMYIDPGSGSMLVQAIVAGILGIAMFLKNIRMYIVSLFTRKKKKEPNSAE